MMGQMGRREMLEGEPRYAAGPTAPAYQLARFLGGSGYTGDEHFRPEGAARDWASRAVPTAC